MKRFFILISIIGIVHTAPELGAIEIRPEAVGTLRQGERDLPIGIRGAVVSAVGISIEGVDRQVIKRFLAGACNRYVTVGPASLRCVVSIAWVSDKVTP